jgi:dolichol-phosphate mannosyltransferase
LSNDGALKSGRTARYHSDMDGIAPAGSTAALAHTDIDKGRVTQPAPELSVIVPTFNERANIPILIDRLSRVLTGCSWEVVFVDDNSPDETAAAIRAIGETDSRVRCIRRIGRRGLAGACLEGMLASQARYVAVMDADLQHDEELLVAMLDCLRAGKADVVVASRYLDGGSAAGLSSQQRARISRWANGLVRLLLGINLTDPMSGHFMIRRETFESLAPEISSQGFKILLDILATARGRLRTIELPSTFRRRQHGESKLDSKIALDFAALVTSKLTGGAISARFLLFCLVGLTGLGIHLSLLSVLLAAPLSFGAAQALATVGAITWNFVLNNLLTYRDQRLTGWRFLTGLIRFQVICAIGAISNVGIATWIYDYDSVWWIAGLGGAVIGTVWNFVVSAAFVWRQR